MTRQEAIRELKQWRDQMKSHGVPDYGKKLIALDLAIEALQESERSDGMINNATKKEALEGIQKSLLAVSHVIELLIEDLKEDIESINGEEIPVSEGFVSALAQIAKDLKELKERGTAE